MKESNKLPRVKSTFRYSRPLGSTSLFTPPFHPCNLNPRSSGSLNKFIKHSFLFTLPHINTLFYKIESFLLRKIDMSTILISRRKNDERDRLIKTLFNKSNNVIFNSVKLLEIIDRKYYHKMILDLEINSIETIPFSTLQLVMWMLISNCRVTRRTKKVLRKIIPNDYPHVTDKG